MKRIAFFAFTIYALFAVDFSIPRMVGGLGKLGNILSHALPPAVDENLPIFARSLLETMAIALAATILAAVVALPLGLLGAHRVIPNWLVRWPLRRGMDVARSIDSLLWALLFVNGVGLGPFAGVMALMMVDLGTLAKLLGEAIDHCSLGPVEGIEAAGANRIEAIRFGILPQVLPTFASQVIYYFESNLRHATMLGIVGAGGIGMHLTDRLRVNEWRQVATIVLLILVAVTMVDRFSRWARLRIEEGRI